MTAKREAEGRGPHLPLLNMDLAVDQDIRRSLLQIVAVELHSSSYETALKQTEPLRPIHYVIPLANMQKHIPKDFARKWNFSRLEVEKLKISLERAHSQVVHDD